MLHDLYLLHDITVNAVYHAFTESDPGSTAEAISCIKNSNSIMPSSYTNKVFIKQHPYTVKKKISYVNDRKHAITSSELDTIPKSILYHYKPQKSIYFRHLKKLKECFLLFSISCSSTSFYYVFEIRSTIDNSPYKKKSYLFQFK